MQRKNTMIDYQSILNDMQKYRKEQNVKVISYEENESWAMAYLSNWVVLEKTVKKLYGAYVKSQLLPLILHWKEYLEGKTSKAPDKITNFSVEPTYIPRVKILEKIVGKTISLSEVLNPDRKWRIKRNAIAHRAEEFARKNTYIEYQVNLNSALDELERRLRTKAK